MSNAGISEIYETARNRIVNSALGVALGLTSDSEILDVAVTIEGVVDNGAISKTFTANSTTQTYTIPKGYHNGSGKITVNPITLANIKKQELTTDIFLVPKGGTLNYNVTFGNLTTVFGIYYMIKPSTTGYDSDTQRDSANFQSLNSISGNIMNVTFGNDADSKQARSRYTFYAYGI